MSVLLAIFGVGIGFFIAILVGSGRGSRSRPVRILSKLYVELFRGLPLILLLVLIHQVLGGRSFGLDFSPRTAAMISLALYSSAYQAEIVHAGLQAVPSQLIDSARVLGSNTPQLFFLIKLRYALRVMLPAFAGQAISLFKDTSVVTIIAVADLMTVARSVLGSDVGNLSFWVSLYLFVGFLYFCVAYGLSRLAERWESRSQLENLVHSLANF